MASLPRRSSLAHAVILALSLPMLVACGRSITSTPGDAPNLEVWAKQVQAKKPTGKREPLPLLMERTVFNYADNTIITLNPNPQAALDAAMANGQQSPSADPTSPPVLELLNLAAKGGQKTAAIDTAAYEAYLNAWKAASDFYGLNRNDLVAAKSFLDKLAAASGKSGITGPELTAELLATAKAAATPVGQSLPEVVPASVQDTPADSEPVKPTDKKPAKQTDEKTDENADSEQDDGVSVIFHPSEEFASRGAVRQEVSLFAAPQARRGSRRAEQTDDEIDDESEQPLNQDQAQDPDSQQTVENLPDVQSALDELDEVLPANQSQADIPAAEPAPSPEVLSSVELARLFAASAYNLRRAGFDLEQSLAFLAVAPDLADHIAQEFALASPDTNRHLFDLATGRRVSPVDVLVLASNEGRGIDSLPASDAIAQFRANGGAARLKTLDAHLRSVGGGEAIRFLVQERGVRRALRNPFELPNPDEFSATQGQTAQPRPDPNRPRQILEQFPLDSLVMVGTMGKGANISALIRAPDRTVYRVKIGQYIGQNDGRVVNIDNGGLDLVELVQDGGNGWVERPASLLME